MYLTLVLLPLIGAITSGFFGRFLGKSGASLISTASVCVSAFLSFVVFYEVGLCQSVCYVKLFSWIDSEMFKADWGLMFDSLTATMLVTVSVVSALVHIYSIAYMSEDPHRPRFMSYLSLFTFFMLILVTADNFIQMFLGWEGVGLSSYLLINFWFTRLQANKSAIKALLVNRVGDFGLALGIMAIYLTFGDISYTTVFAAAPAVASASETFTFLNMEVDKLTAICLLLFIGAVGKSAQLGLHTWLPDAMEGPTPVSALIHAATMVTAGVFLIIRCSPLFEFSPLGLVVVSTIGASTAFFAATTALLQNDLKKVIAYSTCSQLGYMVFACGISNYSASIFHLMNHAFFKALLFLSAGAVIHGFMDEQDMRKMGGLAKILPFTYMMFIIGSMSLVGFPFLTGFYSKDFILELAYGKYSFAGNFAHWLGTLSVFFTCFYSFRLLFLTFLNKTNAYRPVIANTHEVSVITAIPLLVLAFGSIFVGYLMKDMMIGLGTNFWGNALFTLPAHEVHINAEFIPPFIKLIPLVFTASGAFLSFILIHKGTWTLFGASQFGSLRDTRMPTSLALKGYMFFNRKWYFDKIYNSYVTSFFLSLGYNVTFKAIDKGIIELLGPYGISVMAFGWAREAAKLQTGYIYHYAFVILIGLTFAITCSFAA